MAQLTAPNELGLLSRLSRTGLRSARLLHTTRHHRSSLPSSGAKPASSPHVGFYKTFARPVAKVLLMATLTYQVAYFVWLKLEQDEIRAQKLEEVSGLEARVRSLQSSKASQK